jgi:hypothetical protein
MKQEPIFNWDPEEGVASCIIKYKNQTFCGVAMCHEEDKDMMSEKTGMEIAYRRATIDYLKYVRDMELKPALKALKQLYYTMKHSTHFNPKSYENSKLQRHIRMYEFDLETINEIIIDERKNLKDYIDKKDEFYKKTRIGRQIKQAETSEELLFDYPESDKNS